MSEIPTEPEAFVSDYRVTKAWFIRIFWHPWRQARLGRVVTVGGDYPGISVDIPRIGYVILGRVCRSGRCGCCWRCVGP